MNHDEHDEKDNVEKKATTVAATTCKNAAEKKSIDVILSVNNRGSGAEHISCRRTFVPPYNHTAGLTGISLVLPRLTGKASEQSDGE